jgi:phage gp36-like protein
MAYCALADLQTVLDTPTLVDLTDGTGTTPTASVITGVIADADAEIDAKLGERYSVPFATVPGVIKKISKELAIYALYGRHHDRTASEAVKARYDKAIGLLDSISKGEVGLGVITSASSLRPSVAYENPYENNKFTMDLLERDGKDPDSIDE